MYHLILSVTLCGVFTVGVLAGIGITRFNNRRKYKQSMTFQKRIEEICRKNSGTMYMLAHTKITQLINELDAYGHAVIVQHNLAASGWVGCTDTSIACAEKRNRVINALKEFNQIAVASGIEPYEIPTNQWDMEKLIHQLGGEYFPKWFSYEDGKEEKGRLTDNDLLWP